MPPKVALLLTISAVLTLLRLEQKHAGTTTSRILWLPIVWTLSISSKPVGYWFPASGGGVDESSLWDRLCQGVLLLAAVLVLQAKRLRWGAVLREHAWLMVLAGYMFVSILWSDMPFISFKRYVRDLPAIAMGLIIMCEPSPSLAVQRILRRTTYVLIPFSVLLIKYFPEHGVLYNRWSGELMWTGITLQKNGLGRLCFISAFFLIWALVTGWKRARITTSKALLAADVAVLLLTLHLLKGPGGSYSATSIAALIAGLAFFLGLLLARRHGVRPPRELLFTLILVVIICGAAIPFSDELIPGKLASSVGRDASLTGRADIWAPLVTAALRRPLFGTGFGGFWTNTSRSEFNISGAHNGYLSVVLDLGFVGLFLLSMFLLSSTRKAQDSLDHNYEWACLWLSYILMAIIHNTAESSLGGFSTQMAAVLIFLAFADHSRDQRSMCMGTGEPDAHREG